MNNLQLAKAQKQLEELQNERRDVERQNADLEKKNLQLTKVQRQLELEEESRAVQRQNVDQEMNFIKAQKQLEGLQDEKRDVQRQNADLEMKNLQLTKAQKQLEDDNAGLYIALEAKQQELELMKRRLGVRGTAGSTPVASAAPPKRLVRPPPQTASGPTMGPPTSLKRTSVSPTPDLSSSRSLIPRRPSLKSSTLKSTPEESEKENQAPRNPLNSLDDTPKPSTLRRRVMIAA